VPAATALGKRAWHYARPVFIAAGILVCALLLIDLWAPVDLQPLSTARVVVDSRGEPLRAFADQNGEWRYQVGLDQVSPDYVQTLIGYEDRWFYHHLGVNPLSLLRAAWQWLRHGHIVSGGSTLTMQVARIRYPGHGGIGDKLRQIVRALQLELHYSKDEILTYYINHAPFGGPLQGVEAASRSYFGYPAARLTRAQGALLAVLPQAPSRYRPDRYPERARLQRDKVLDRLVEFGLLSPEEAADAKLEGVAATPPHLKPLAPLLARRLIGRNTTDHRVTAFIDRQLQRRLETLAREQLHQLPQHASLAIEVMEHGSGKVVAYLGSAGLGDMERFGYIDMVTAERSPGSTLKPFIYGMAMDEGLIHSESLLLDAPLAFGDYRPLNFSRGFSGPVSVSHALQLSLNVPAVQVLERLDPAHFFARMQTAGAGLHLPPGATPSLAIALGGVATNLERLLGLYSALGNDGYAIVPRLTPDDPLQKRRLLSPGSAWIIRDILSHRREETTWQQGLAIKTGTSYGNRDAWAIGVGRHHTIGVWVGRPDNAAMTGHYGSYTAVPILRAAAAILPNSGPGLPARPANVSRKAICWPTGQETPQLCDEQRQAWIVDDVIPATFMGSVAQSPLIPNPYLTLRLAGDSGLRTALGCNIASAETTLPVWPAPLQSWLPAKWRTNTRIPPLDPRCKHSAGLLSETPVQIIGLDKKARLKRHATTAEQPLLGFRAVGGQPQWYWFLNGELLESQGDVLKLPMPEPGKYQLAVTDQAGMSDTLEFTVEPEENFR
jgi:penicillin-binding protein 1C